MEAEAIHQTKVFEAAILFARKEGIVPAPESSHAIAAVVNEAIKCREAGTKKCCSSTFPDRSCWT